jgi:hypothetical protein
MATSHVLLGLDLYQSQILMIKSLGPSPTGPSSPDLAPTQLIQRNSAMKYATTDSVSVATASGTG